MKRLLFLGLILLASSVRADDSAVTGASGHVHRLGGEHTSVRMVSETVDIRVRDFASYTTDATFVFHNDGAATTVKMGFPEWGHDEGGGNIDKKRSSFYEFATWADGRRLNARRQWNNKDEAFWVKEVPFRAGQTRRVRVRFRSPFGDSSGMPGSRWIQYGFTGGNWKGKLDRARLTLHLDREGTYLLKGSIEKSKPVFARNGSDFSWTWTNWGAEDYFSVSLDATLRNWMVRDGTSTSLKNYLPINIGKVGREDEVDFVPDAVKRGEELYVNARSWATAIGATTHWDAASSSLIVQVDNLNYEGRFRAGRNGAFRVRGGSEHPNSTLFVSRGEWLNAFTGGFAQDLARHTIRSVSGEGAVGRR